jgi:hypothetical protein
MTQPQHRDHPDRQTVEEAAHRVVALAEQGQWHDARTLALQGGALLLLELGRLAGARPVSHAADLARVVRAAYQDHVKEKPRRTHRQEVATICTLAEEWRDSLAP